MINEDKVVAYGVCATVIGGCMSIAFNLFAIVSMAVHRAKFPPLIMFQYLFVVNTFGLYHGIEALTSGVWFEYQLHNTACPVMGWIHMMSVLFAVMFATAMAVFSYCISANSPLTRTARTRNKFLIVMGVVVSLLTVTAPTVSLALHHFAPSKRLCWISNAYPDNSTKSVIYNIFMFSIYKMVAMILNIVFSPMTFHNARKVSMESANKLIACPATTETKAMISTGLAHLLSRSIFSSCVLIAMCVFDVVDVITVIINHSSEGLNVLQATLEFIWPFQEFLIAISYNRLYLDQWFKR